MTTWLGGVEMTTWLIVGVYLLVGFAVARFMRGRVKLYRRGRHSLGCTSEWNHETHSKHYVACGSYCWRDTRVVRSQAVAALAGALLIWPFYFLVWSVAAESLLPKRRPIADTEWIERTERELGIGGDK